MNSKAVVVRTCGGNGTQNLKREKKQKKQNKNKKVQRAFK
jgi:hypothetical protein